MIQKKIINYLIMGVLVLSNFYFPIESNAITSSSYKVQKGDTLYSIAKKFHTTTTQLQKDNHLKSLSVKTGQLLSIHANSYLGTPAINNLPTITNSNSDSYSVSGSASSYASVTLSFKDKKGVSSVYTVKADSKGKFTFKANLKRLTDGTIILTSYQKDTKGIKSSSVTKSLIKDTIAPSVSVQATSISLSNQSSYTISGTTSAYSTVKVAISDSNNHTIVISLSADSKGKFSKKLDVHTLLNGTVSVQAIASDKYGNSSLKTVNVAKSVIITYNLDAAARTKFGIYNDGTHPVETTKGLNDALKWAQANKYNLIKVPTGTYLIDKENSVNLVSDLTLELDANATFQKETNSHEGYSVVYVGPGVQNATIEGGTLLGDRETHDYSKAEFPWTSGTHEWGYGVNIAGGRNITVQGMKIQKMTGDGITIGGSTMGGGGTFDSSSLELGGLDAKGQPIVQDGKIRTVANSPITNFSRIKSDMDRIVELWLPNGLTNNDYTVCYYRKDNSFIRCDVAKVYTKPSIPPQDADHFRLVLNAPSTKDVNVQWMVIEDAKGVFIKNNDIGYNRRQGITAGGEDVQILNNKIHHTSGTAPQSGIDIEPGFFPAINHTIKGNTFLDNKIQVVLCWGTNVTLDGNYFEQTSAIKGGVGAYIYPMYQGAKVTNNTFKGSGLSVGPDNAIVESNHFLVGSSASLSGMNQTMKNSDFTNASLSIGNKPGQKLENVTITNDGKDPENHAGLSVWSNAVNVSNVKLIGTPDHKVTIGGYTSVDSVFDHLTMINGATGTTGFPQGTYKNSTFTYTGNKTSNLAIQYNANVTIENSTFNNQTVGVYTQTATGTIKNSTFNFSGDLSSPAIYVPEAKNVSLLNNVFHAEKLSLANQYMIKIGQYAWATHPFKIFGATVSGNTIYANSKVLAKGIDTTEKGIGAPKFTVTNNTLYNSTLQLTSDDINTGNKLLKK